MDIEKYTLQSIRQELIDNNLQAKAIIQVRKAEPNQNKLQFFYLIQ